MKTIDLAENDPQTHIKFAELAKIIFKARKSAVITGAGISCNAGIPDFRSSEGLYNLVKEKHPTAVVKGQDLFDISLFRSELSLAVFCTFMESLYLSTLKATPTETHKFIKTLKEKKKLLRCYTQNIDGLERNIELKTGVRSDQFGSGKTFLQAWKSLDVVQLHGDLHHLSCTHCFHTTQWTPDHKLQLSQGENPECQNCYMKYQERLYLGKRLTGNIGLLRPAIVLYGENHPQAEILAQGLNCDVRAKPDMLIIMGTSLRVDGVKKLVKTLASAVHDKGGKVVFVNKTPVAKTTWENIIDYEVLCDCDDFVAQLKYEIPDLFLTQEQLDSKRLKNKRVKRVKREEKVGNEEVKTEEVGNEEVRKEEVKNEPQHSPQGLAGSLGLTPPSTPHKKRPALKRKNLAEKLSKPKLNFELPTPVSSFSEMEPENFNALKIKKEERDCEPLLLVCINIDRNSKRQFHEVDMY